MIKSQRKKCHYNKFKYQQKIKKATLYSSIYIGSQLFRIFMNISLKKKTRNKYIGHEILTLIATLKMHQSVNVQKKMQHKINNFFLV